MACMTYNIDWEADAKALVTVLDIIRSSWANLEEGGNFTADELDAFIATLPEAAHVVGLNTVETAFPTPKTNYDRAKVFITGVIDYYTDLHELEEKKSKKTIKVSPKKKPLPDSLLPPKEPVPDIWILATGMKLPGHGCTTEEEMQAYVKNLDPAGVVFAVSPYPPGNVEVAAPSPIKEPVKTPLELDKAKYGMTVAEAFAIVLELAGDGAIDDQDAEVNGLEDEQEKQGNAISAVSAFVSACVDDSTTTEGNAVPSIDAKITALSMMESYYSDFVTLTWEKEYEAIRLYFRAMDYLAHRYARVKSKGVPDGMERVLTHISSLIEYYKKKAVVAVKAASAASTVTAFKEGIVNPEVFS